MPFRHFLVESSNLQGVAYDPDTRELVVNFKTGDPYHYTDVPPEHIADIMFSKSVGKAFNALIKKGGFTFRKLRANEVSDLGIELPDAAPRERVKLSSKKETPADVAQTEQAEQEVDTPDFTMDKPLEKAVEEVEQPVEEPEPELPGRRFPVPLAFPDEDEEEPEGTAITEKEES